MIATNSHRANGARALRDQSRRVLRDVKGLGSIAADEVGNRANRLVNRGKEMLADGRESIERVGDQAKSYITENPFKSLAVAVGVGALLGLMLRRR